MPTISEYTKVYDISSKTQAIIAEDKVVSVTKFDICPYVWLGEMKAKVEAGLIKWVSWNMIGAI